MLARAVVSGCAHANGLAALENRPALLARSFSRQLEPVFYFAPERLRQVVFHAHVPDIDFLRLLALHLFPLPMRHVELQIQHSREQQSEDDEPPRKDVRHQSPLRLYVYNPFAPWLNSLAPCDPFAKGRSAPSCRKRRVLYQRGPPDPQIFPP